MQQPTPADMAKQAKLEVASIEKQIDTFEKANLLMQQAQAELRKEEGLTPFETAMDLFLGAQLTHAVFTLDLLRNRKAQMEEFIRQAESPIQRVGVIQKPQG
jgi:hypothetical protein